MILKFTVYIFLLLLLVFILFDIIPKLNDWFSRIHIGRFKNKTEWQKSITNRGEKWLIHTPRIMVTDNTRLILIDIIKGNYSRKEIQYWQEASIILGLTSQTSVQKKSKALLQKYLNTKFDKNGDWKSAPTEIDAAILAYSVMKIDCMDTKKYKKAFDYTWNLIRDHVGEDGTVGYRKSMMAYRYVDTIGFICPFLIAYGNKFKKQECIDLAIKQIKSFEKYGILKQHFIPAHAYKVSNYVPVGLYGWGRGMGWYALGLIDSWKELSLENNDKHYLEESIVRLAKAALKLQQLDGSWKWTITRDESRSDSSTTAILAWFMLNASQIKELSIECNASTQKAVSFLMNVTRRNGAVDFSQGDTKDIGVYSMLFNILPFTQGLCIRIINSMKL
ncbi:glycoside hydrolase family 88 protein [Metabacillus idriensis]|uniref:glycoside hydrolase family 88 protein n=1 Tax=Metabacillus idriensis TaxID=324768 RepID=UPI003D268D36